MIAFLSFGSFLSVPVFFLQRNQEVAIHRLRECCKVIRYLETRIKEYELAILYLIDRMKKREPASSISI